MAVSLGCWAVFGGGNNWAKVHQGEAFEAKGTASVKAQRSECMVCLEANSGKVP